MTDSPASSEATAAGTPDAPVAVRAEDDAGAAAATLALVLATGLALLLPIRAMVATTTYGGYYAWIAATAVIVAGVALAARAARLPLPFATTFGTLGAFAVLVPAGLALLAATGNPGSDAEIVLIVVLAASGLTAIAVTALVRAAPELVPMAAVAAVTVGVVSALGFGTPAWQAVRDAQEDVADVAEFEASGLTPYLVEIDGLEATFASTSRLVQGNTVTGYTLDYSADPDDYSVSSIAIEVALIGDDDPCAIYDCEMTDGYTVVRSAGDVRSVFADHGSIRITATSQVGSTALPDTEEIGAALSSAEDVEWSDIVGLPD